MSDIIADGQKDVAPDADQDSTPDAVGSETTMDTTDLGDTTERSDTSVSLAPELDASELRTVEIESAPRGSGSKKGSQKHSTCQMVELELHDIYDEHPLVEELRDLNVALRELPVRTITKTGLITLAEHSPLHVMQKEDKKYYCIGGLRIFRLLKCDLPSSTRLHVILQGGLSDKQLKNQIYFDLFAMPIFSGLNMKDRRIVGALWRTERGMKLFSQAFGADDSKKLAAILGCDSRTLKRSELETPSS